MYPEEHRVCIAQYCLTYFITSILHTIVFIVSKTFPELHVLAPHSHLHVEQKTFMHTGMIMIGRITTQVSTTNSQTTVQQNKTIAEQGATIVSKCVFLHFIETFRNKLYLEEVTGTQQGLKDLMENYCWCGQENKSRRNQKGRNQLIK